MLKIWMIIEKIKTDIVEAEEGITSIEYAVLAALVVAGLVVAVPFLTSGLTSSFTSIGTKMQP
jgi:Flp pilus assembly pilin Flp